MPTLNPAKEPEKAKAIHDAYLAGKKPLDLAKEYGVTHCSILRCIRSFVVKKTRKREEEEGLVEKITKLLDFGCNVQQIQRHLGVGEAKIYAIIHNHDLSLPRERKWAQLLVEMEKIKDSKNAPKGAQPLIKEADLPGFCSFTELPR